MKTITLPSKTIPLIEESDICVIGGSCTGVFAAVRAARLGAKVCIIELQNRFGGVAVSSLVNIWHSLYDTSGQEQIIAGLSLEVLERLSRRDAVSGSGTTDNFLLNPDELAIELDELIIEAKVKPFLHTMFTVPYIVDGKLEGVVVENKSGSGLIKAEVFIDASGDADLCERAGLSVYTPDDLQPSTTCAKFANWPEGIQPELGKHIRDFSEKYKLPPGYIWGRYIPNSNIYMLSGTRIVQGNCANAEDLTRAEIEGRRQVRALTDILRNELNRKELSLQALASYIGIRETRHINSLYKLSHDDLLNGLHFDDAVANGTYPVDIHHKNKAGITVKRLDGSQIYSRPGHEPLISRWREETGDCPACYQIPLRSIIPLDSDNIITAGRMIDADREAFGAARVMINLNQLGEAAGVTAFLALSEGKKPEEVSPQQVRKLLSAGGSAII
jgi:hypothetical protein